MTDLPVARQMYKLKQERDKLMADLSDLQAEYSSISSVLRGLIDDLRMLCISCIKWLGYCFFCILGFVPLCTIFLALISGKEWSDIAAKRLGCDTTALSEEVNLICSAILQAFSHHR